MSGAGVNVPKKDSTKCNKFVVSKGLSPMQLLTTMRSVWSDTAPYSHSKQPPKWESLLAILADKTFRQYIKRCLIFKTVLRPA